MARIYDISGLHRILMTKLLKGGNSGARAKFERMGFHVFNISSDWRIVGKRLLVVPDDLEFSNLGIDEELQILGVLPYVTKEIETYEFEPRLIGNKRSKHIFCDDSWFTNTFHCCSLKFFTSISNLVEEIDVYPLLNLGQYLYIFRSLESFGLKKLGRFHPWSKNSPKIVWDPFLSDEQNLEIFWHTLNHIF